MLLRYNLEAEGYEVEAVGARRRRRYPSCKEIVADLVVLDWMRAGRCPASSLCRRLCARALRPRRLPIIMLTARGEESDRVRGLCDRRRRLSWSSRSRRRN